LEGDMDDTELKALKQRVREGEEVSRDIDRAKKFFESVGHGFESVSITINDDLRETYCVPSEYRGYIVDAIVEILNKMLDEYLKL
jgi:hypothetical protein